MADQVKKRPLNNLERLAIKRGVNVTLIYDIDKHKYRDYTGLHYIPYNVGNNEAKRKRRANDCNAKHHSLYERRALVK